MRLAARGRSLAFVGALVLAILGVFAVPPALAVPPAFATDPPKTPQQVADYFANGLIPRLIDLYGSGNTITGGIDFDASTKVGKVSRVLEWTPDFLAGRAGENPTRLTNTWVAPVSVRGSVLGLANVWINPETDAPELAEFDSPELAAKLAAAPPKSLLVNDPEHDAWFAIDGTTLTPLVSGSSGTTAPTTTTAYQKTISTVTSAPSQNPPGVAFAALVLGIVVLGLAIFVLLPLRKRPVRDELEEALADAGAAGGVAEDEPDVGKVAKAATATAVTTEPSAASESTPSPVAKKPTPRKSAAKPTPGPGLRPED